MFNFFKKLFSKKKKQEPAKVISIPGIYSKEAKDSQAKVVHMNTSMSTGRSYGSESTSYVHDTSNDILMNALILNEVINSEDCCEPLEPGVPTEVPEISSAQIEVQGGSQVKYSSDGELHLYSQQSDSIKLEPVMETPAYGSDKDYGTNNDYGTSKDYGASNDYGSRDSGTDSTYNAHTQSYDQSPSYSSPSYESPSYDSGSSYSSGGSDY